MKRILLSAAAALALSAAAGAFALANAADAAPAATSAAAAADPTQAARMGPWGFDVTGMDRSVKPGDDFGRFVGSEIRRWAEVVKRGGIRID